MALFRRKREQKLMPAPKLHVGAGRARLDGWVNVDLQPLPGVDVVADVTQGLRFTGVEALFAEHFLEHLPVAAATGRCSRKCSAKSASTPVKRKIGRAHV